MLDESTSHRIGVPYLRRKSSLKIGCRRADTCPSSQSYKDALAEGLINAGIIDVIDIVLVGTEKIYSTAFHLDMDGVIEVTASYNSTNYNGIKLVYKGAYSINGDSGL